MQGPSHAADGTVCQDCHLVRVVEYSATEDSSSEAIIACVADGAGSAKHSDIGATLTCHSIVEHAEEYLLSHGDLHSLQLDTVFDWCESSRERIRTAASERGCKFRDMATTLCAAILTPRGSVFFQIGDGAITVGKNGVYGVVFWPQSGEYVNTTNFITSDTFRDEVEFQATTSTFTEIAVFTDGIERLALNFESQIPYLPFFQPLFQAIRTTTSRDSLEADLGNFLSSDSVTKRSDDDMTLVLAANVAESTMEDPSVGTR